MTAENEVSKEVAAIEEKCGLDMSSYQDLPKLVGNGITQSDQISDPDNSYVFVTGDGGVIDDPVEGKEVVVTAEGLSVDLENRKLDVVNDEVRSENLRVGENVDLEKNNVDLSAVNVLEQDRSPLDADKAQASVADATGEQKLIIETLGEADIEEVEDLSGRLESLIEAEIEKVVDQNGKIDGVAGTELKQFEDPNGSSGNLGEAEIERAVDKNEKAEHIAETEINPVQDSNVGLETLIGDDIEKVADQNGKNEGVVESEIKQDLNGSPESSAEVDVEKVTVADQIGKIEGIVELETMKVEDPSCSIKSSEGAEIEKTDDQNGKFEGVAENEIKQVEDLNGSLASSVGAEIEEADDQNGKFEGVAENEIKQVEDLNGSLASSVGAEIEEADDRNGKLEGVTENKIKQVEDLNGSLASSVGAEIETVGDKNENSPNVDETETKQVLDPGRNIESLAGAEIENSTDKHWKIEGVGEREIKQVEDLSEISKSSTVAKTESVGDKNGKAEGVLETEITKVEDLNGSLASSRGSEIETEGAQNGNLPNVDETEIKQAENPNGRLERLVEVEIETVGDSDVNIEGAAETKIKDITDINGKPGSSEGAVIEMVEDTKTGLMAETEGKEVGDQTKYVPSPAPAKNQESEVGTPVVVAKSEESKDLNNMLSHLSESGNTHVEYEDQNHLHTSETSEVCRRYLNVVDAADSEMQEVSTEGQNEVKLAREMETIEHETPLAASIDSESETHSNINKEEGSSLNVMEKGNTAPVTDAEVLLQQVDEAKNVVDSGEQHDRELVVEENVKEVSSLSDVEDSVQNAEEPEKQYDDNKGVSEILQSKAENEAFVPTQNIPAPDAHEPEICTSAAETVESSSSPVDGPKSQVIENGPSGKTSCSSSGPDSVIGTVVCTEKEPNFQGRNDHVETEASSVNCPSATRNVKLETELNDSSAASSKETTDDVTVTSRMEVLNSSDASKGGESNIASEKSDVKDMGDQLDSSTGSNDESSLLRENEVAGDVLNDSISVVPPECSSTDVISGEDTNIAAVTRPFNYLIRIPRFNDENLKEEIGLAKLEVDEKTKLREAIQIQIQEKRASIQIYGIDYEYAKGEERNARKLVRSKRMEIDSLQSMINKAKNAISIDDIDYRISNMEHMIQHETLPLKEEKQLIREIKQLKQLREQLSLNMGSQDEIKQALEKREEVEESLRIARKELDGLKANVKKAEAAFVEAQMKYSDENKKVRELQTQFRAADEIRQEAYVQWQSLRKQLAEKNRYFFKCKDDESAASNYAYSRDTEALYRLCTDQVEQVMELWNTNEEFRKEYATYNTRSTVRRLGTLDGRSLGPDEVPLILPNYVDDRVDRRVSKPTKVDSITQSPVELKLETSVEKRISEDKPKRKETEQKNQTLKTEIILGNGLANVLGRDSPAKVQEEEPLKSKEEVELAKKAEEIRKEEAEVKLKEQRRIEELAKASEARERKKRQAEKLQMRAELKAQKEAEQKEKEREKRLRKKEHKKVDVSDNKSSSDSAPSSESAMEIMKEIETTKEIIGSKKAQKSSKQNKTKTVIPPALRNRNRKKWQQYMWLAATSLVVFALFWLGNMGMFSDVYIKRQSPGY